MEYTVSEKDLPAKVGQILRLRLGLTANQISRVKFKERGICVNGQQVRVTEQVVSGDVIRVCLESEEDGSVHLEAVPGQVDILYEDEDILLVNKPAGVAVHPAHGHYQDTLANHLVDYYRRQGKELCVRPVGRLDKDTSGIVLFAKNQVAAARLTAAGDKTAVQKEYWALVKGIPSPLQGCINEPLKPVQEELNRMVVSEKGKPAITHYQVIKEYQEYSLVKLWLETGRTHQIRVHMASVGHPLLGDGIYGERESRIVRAALHCRKISLRQPFTGDHIAVTAPFPEDMKKFICE